MISSEIGVQNHWNMLENCIIQIVDSIVPLVETAPDSVYHRARNVNNSIKTKMNLRKRLILKDRLLGSGLNRGRIKELKKEVAAYFSGVRRDKVRLTANGGGK